MTEPMELCEEIRSTASPRKRKAEDSSDDIENGMVDEEQGGDEEESDASSREEGQEWDVDSFDDGFDYRPKRNLDPNDELGKKMHQYTVDLKCTGARVSMWIEKTTPGNVAYRPLISPIDDLDQPYKTTGLTCRLSCRPWWICL
ncbi:hypothetical protein V5N11_023815 [Cardamine amara subsp. amara]|uniref:Uncharacterized protein n=1 Tax=Cardamine amara subsp. amara TaxID=228776 RepID=A0ABD1AYR2_CARAN